ncbi:MAG: twin-arginine translocase subunit TatB [Clostridia bacterium]|nr:twin-arginine translocase subunit TatB [Clostridia bacterium]
MLNIGFAELMLVLIIAYVIVGPKDLPKVARWLARLLKKAKRLLQDVKDEVGWDEMMAETEDVRKDIDQTLKEADVTKEIRDVQHSFRDFVKSAEKDTMKKP